MIKLTKYIFLEIY